MASLIRFFVRFNLVGDLLMIAILSAGWVGMGSTRSNFFPVTESKTIQIQVVYPGASPAEIEEGIVAKIEENLQGIAGLDQVQSVCSENAGSITVKVLSASETDDILQDVKNQEGRPYVNKSANCPTQSEKLSRYNGNRCTKERHAHAQQTIR